MQTHPSQIEKLINKISEGYDVVYGKYTNTASKGIKKITSNLHNYSVEKLIGKPKGLKATSFWICLLYTSNDKHVFVEKPSTTNYQDSLNLVKLAEERKLVLHENYMFQYHSQISEIKKEVENGKIGKVHSYHARFGFPRRDKNDFRYNKELGGGALLDAGGYVIKRCV